MKYNITISTLCTLLLLLLWTPVALDKLGDLEGFRQILLQQPLPAGWADVLYWLVPVVELACVVLLVAGSTGSGSLKTVPLKIAGLAGSSLLLLGFTLFILFGVLGWYEQRPCGCGSVISGLSSEQHLWFDAFFLAVSLLGLWTVWKEKLRSGSDTTPTPPSGGADDSGAVSLFLMLHSKGMDRYRVVFDRIRYPRKFALFPGRPVQTEIMIRSRPVVKGGRNIEQMPR